MCWNASAASENHTSGGSLPTLLYCLIYANAFTCGSMKSNGFSRKTQTSALVTVAQAMYTPILLAQDRALAWTKISSWLGWLATRNFVRWSYCQGSDTTKAIDALTLPDYRVMRTNLGVLLVARILWKSTSINQIAYMSGPALLWKLQLIGSVPPTQCR